MNSKAFNRNAAIIFMVIGAFFVFESRTISQSSLGSKVGPNIFPMGLGSILILLSIRLLYETFKSKVDKKSNGGLLNKKMSSVIAAIIVYIFIFEPLGYIISTFLFLTAMFLIMDRTKVGKSVLISLVFSISIYYLYVNLFMGTLPPLPEWLKL
ncbi:MAG: transporter [Clostridia bacterium]|jgi:putative tricarboxylic transport membrane protein|nr:transporter [Clostridia bacterium]